MELYFLVLLVAIMVFALTSGYPVAFSLPGAAIATIAIAAFSGYMIEGDVDAYFVLGGPNQWLLLFQPWAGALFVDSLGNT